MLDAIDPRERATLLQVGVRRRFGRGEVVFHEGDPGDALHVVTAGVFVARGSSTMGEVIAVNVFAAGDVFGELVLLTPGARRSATVAALSASATLMVAQAHFEALRARAAMFENGTDPASQAAPTTAAGPSRRALTAAGPAWRGWRSGGVGGGNGRCAVRPCSRPRPHVGVSPSNISARPDGRGDVCARSAPRLTPSGRSGRPRGGARRRRRPALDPAPARPGPWRPRPGGPGWRSTGWSRPGWPARSG